MKKITKEIMEDIKEKLGCVGLLIIATDSKIPCPDILSGVPCAEPHEICVGVNNITSEACIAIVIKEFGMGYEE